MKLSGYPTAQDRAGTAWCGSSKRSTKYLERRKKMFF